MYNSATTQNSQEEKPQSVNILFHNIPKELTSQKRWVVWRYTLKRGKAAAKWTKVPYQVNSPQYGADSTNSHHWATYEQACQLYHHRRKTFGKPQQFDGIGFVLGNGFCGVDFDKCRIDGHNTWATNCLAKLHTYSEISPSKTGVKCIARAGLLGKGRKFTRQAGGGIEVYDDARFFTITGQSLNGSDIRPAQKFIDKLYQTVANKSRIKKDVPSFVGSTCTDGEWKTQFKGDLRTLKIVELLQDSGLAPIEIGDGQWEIFCPWCDEHTGGDVASIWKEEDKCPQFNCFHAHCEGRTIADVLVGIGAEKVDKYCGKKFTLPTDEEILSVISPEPLLGEQHGRRIVPIDEVLQAPAPTWRVRGHIYQDGLSIIYGDAGSLKTFYGLEMAFCEATGRPFLDKFAVAQTPVVYVYSEAAAGLKKRLMAWIKHHGIKPTNFLPIPYSFRLNDPNEVAELLRIMSAYPNVRHLVIDTLSKNLDGSDSDPKDMNKFLNNLNFIREHRSMHITTVHHMGKDASRGPRGMSNIRCDVDTLIEMSKEGDNRVKVHFKKQKDEIELGYWVKPEKVWLPEIATPDDEKPSSLILLYDGVIESEKKQEASQDARMNERIIEFMATKPDGITHKEVMSILSVGERYCDKLMKELKAQGVVEFCKHSKKTLLTNDYLVKLEAERLKSEVQ